MRIQKQKTAWYKKRAVLLIILAILIVSGATIFWWWHKQNNNSATTSGDNTPARPVGSVDYNTPASDTDQQATDSLKDSGKDDSTIDSSKPASFSVTITRVSVDTNAKIVTVGSQVEGTSSGACTLKATKDGQSTVTKTGDVQLNTNAYSCPVFTIPFSDFPTSGEWKFTLSVTNNGATTNNEWASAVMVQK